MFRGRGGNGDTFTGGSGTNVDGTFLDAPDPKCEEAIDYGVEDNCDGGVEFRGLKTQLVVPVEGCGADCEGCVAECETYVSQFVRLFELKGVEVGGDGVVGSVFEV